MRFLFIALFMVLTTHVSAQEAQGVAVKSPSIGEQNSGKRQAEAATADGFSFPVRVIESPEDAKRSRYREDKSDANQDADLIEQRRAADAAVQSAASSKRQENFTIAQIAIGTVGSFFVLAALALAFQSNRIARDMGMAQTRAYVHIERAEVTWGGRSGNNPTVTLTAVNTGQTPAKWFEVVSKSFVRGLADGVEKSGFDFSAIDLSDRKIVSWSALGGGGELTLTSYHREDFDALCAAYGRKDMSVNVVGIVRYETFFGEVFESEFWFTRRPIPGFVETEISRTMSGSVTNIETVEKPRALQRASCRMRTYAKIS